MMKNLIIASLLLMPFAQSASAQKVKVATEGTGYYLPRTELRFTVKIEKTSILLENLQFMPRNT